MGKVTNTFIKSKLNKDLDARILPNGEYRDAQNVQVSRSEGANVGSLENSLGNIMTPGRDFAALTGNDNLLCIGYLADDTKNGIYVFLTDYTDENPAVGFYSNTASNYIYRYDIANDTSTLLVEGSFLNFSKTNPIYGINLLEDLLFWTDNRNQPRKINVDFAAQSITYYINEDQISVAKYNPYRSIEMFREITAQMAVDNPALLPGVGDYQTTMVDVTSKYFPNGGSGDVKVDFVGGGAGPVEVIGVKGDILAAGNPYDSGGIAGADISYIASTGAMVSTGQKVLSVVVNAGDPNILDVTADGILPQLDEGVELIFNPNPYYDENFAGDPNYLEDLFVRFSYRFRFDDGEYSIFAPFTQVAFIPKQDGYFMYVKTEGIPEKDDQTATYRSTVVSFVENKVDDIKLMIPLPEIAKGDTVANALKVSEIDILYKESDGLAVKVIETIKIDDAVVLGDSWIYNYQSIKPFKTLPSDEIIRVYDKTPVRALAQEVISNRVVYGNYQNKHTPPASLNYNVAATEKSTWSLLTGSADAVGVQPNNTTINISNTSGTIIVGSTITGWGNVPSGVVTVIEVIGVPPTQIITDVDTGVVNAGDPIIFNPPSGDSNRTSVIEYPNHSLKQNRSYQVGVVLSDRYGRQSTVILSNNKDSAEAGSSTFGASTIYSPYIGEEVEQNEWRGESLKVLFNEVVGPAASNLSSGWPGLYNGDASSPSYNPLGWYTYKIVVKQTEQEYYNVYLGGIMAAYPEDTTLEIGNTSHVSLINDNINKVPRDLTEVGPDQKQYRSSVELFGRVENMSTEVLYSPSPYPSNIGVTNEQYFPAREADTVSTISTLNDLFEFDPTAPPKPNYYPQIYLSESNPLVARISTESKIGQVATTNYGVASATVLADVAGTLPAGPITLTGIAGALATDMIVTGPGIPEDTRLLVSTPGPIYNLRDSAGVDVLVKLTAGDELSFVQAFATVNGGELITPGLQYLAVYETEPVQSNLDIFWETSTSGIISDLNTLILNSTGGGFGIDGFNTNDWNEAIVVDEDILNTPFRIIDNFGATITGLTVDGVGVDSISLLSVINHAPPEPFSENVQLPVGSEYFELYQSTTPDYFNIKVTQSYWDDIYFGDDATVRNFEFNIETIVGGVSTIYPEEGNPNNIDPTLTPITMNCGEWLVTTRHAENLVQIHGVNGSSNPALRDLSLEWVVVSQKDLTTNDDEIQFFSMTPQTPTEAPEFASESWLHNTLPGNIPPHDYQVVVKLSDPLASAACMFNFQMGVTPASVEDLEWYVDCYGANGTDPDELLGCIIHVINPLQPSQTGYYIPPGVQSFGNLLEDVFGGGVISLDRTGPHGCVPEEGQTLWIFNTDRTAAIDEWKSCAQMGGGGGSCTENFWATAVDVSNNEFEVV